MGTIAEKLEYLAGTKQEIADAIRGKGVTIPAHSSFREYATLIGNIETAAEHPVNLVPVTLTPTGKNFTLYPEDNTPPADGYSAATVVGDYNLKPENIAEGITVYGVTGTLKVRADMGENIPAEYLEYFNRARQLYTGDYDYVMILEQSDYIGVGFLLAGFTVQSYNESSTEFTASQWVYCGYRKANGVWSVQNWAQNTSEGGNFIRNIRYCNTTIYYGNMQIYPFVVNGAPEVVIPEDSGDPTATFTVTFKNGDEVLQVVNNVPYGGYATYTGPTPTPKNPGQVTNVFIGWNPYPYNVRSDLICQAKFHSVYINNGESRKSWNAIIADRGASVPIGEYKLLNIGTAHINTGGSGTDVNLGSVRMRKVAEGEGGTTSTWVAMDVLQGRKWAYYTKNGNYNSQTTEGWAQSYLRDYLNNDIFPAFPEELKRAIVPVTKYTYIYVYNNGVSPVIITNSQSTDYLWIPSVQELFGDGEGYESGGMFYSIYEDGSKRRACDLSGNFSGTLSYWLRSVNKNNPEDYFCSVFGDSLSRDKALSYSACVVIGFCL